MAEKKKKFGSFRKKKSMAEEGTFLRPLIPQLQLDCISYLEKRALKMEGILRISGSNLTIKELQKQYEKGKDVNLEEVDNVHTVACLLKNHFRDSPEPLLTFERYDDFVNTISLEASERLLFVKALVGQLPDSNQEQLHQLLGFLNKVAKYSLENKMDLGNLATMFGPNLMRGEDQSPTDLLRDMQGIRMVMLLMLQNRYDIFPDWPDEQQIKPDRIKAFRLMEIAMNKHQLDIDRELMLMEIESGYRLEKSNRYGSLVKVGSHGKNSEIKAGIASAQRQAAAEKQEEKEGKEKARKRKEGKEEEEVEGAGEDRLAALAKSLDLEGVNAEKENAERGRGQECLFDERPSLDMDVTEILIRDPSKHRKTRKKKTASNPTNSTGKGGRLVVSADRHEFSAVNVGPSSPTRNCSSPRSRKSHKKTSSTSKSPKSPSSAKKPESTPESLRRNSAPNVEEAAAIAVASVKRSKSPNKRKKRRRSESTKRKRSVVSAHNSNHDDEAELEMAVTDLLEKNQKVKKNLMKQLSPRGQKPPPKKK